MNNCLVTNQHLVEVFFLIDFQRCLISLIGVITLVWSVRGVVFLENLL
jgi:hypothetical protein